MTELHYTVLVLGLDMPEANSFNPIFFQFCWDVADVHHCINLRYILYDGFDLYTYEMIVRIVTVISFKCNKKETFAFCVVLRIYFLNNFPKYQTALLAAIINVHYYTNIYFITGRLWLLINFLQLPFPILCFC